MASDLAATPRSGFDVQCCGDAHLSNFGLFGSPERRLVFDVNDFDETLPGPWEWDLKRLVGEHGGGRAGARVLARASASASCSTTAARLPHVHGDASRPPATWTSGTRASTSTTCSAPLAAEVDARTRKSAEKVVAKARTRDSMDALSKLTRIVDGEPRIVSKPPLIVTLEELSRRRSRDVARARARPGRHEYRSTLPDDRCVLLDGYEMADAAHKVVGVGSVGTQAWIVLLLGRDDGDPLFLQVKEAQASVLRGLPRRESLRATPASASSRGSA